MLVAFLKAIVHLLLASELLRNRLHLLVQLWCLIHLAGLDLVHMAADLRLLLGEGQVPFLVPIQDTRLNEVVRPLSSLVQMLLLGGKPGLE